MTDRNEIREFLMSRRARLAPEDVGIPRGTDRRVPGLRREEAAALAGVSVEYYARLERGVIGGASESVLDGIARALRMDEAEREHFHRLVAESGRAPVRQRARKQVPDELRVSSSVQWFLDSVESAAALIGNGRTDLIAYNQLGGALMHEMIASATTDPPNFARFIFLEPVARRFYADWDVAASVNVAQLRTEAGRAPHSKPLHDLVGELCTRSDHFAQLWGRHDVWLHEGGVKRFHHHVVGDIELHYNGLDLVGHPGLQLTVMTAEPGSPDRHALQLLGNWASTIQKTATDLKASMEAKRPTEPAVGD